MKCRVKLGAFCISWLPTPQIAISLDRFNYGETVNQSAGGTDYGPPEWDHVVCPNLTQCLGYPDTWWYSKQWSLPTTKSDCLWCPLDGPPCTFVHHQSPIPLTRKVADPASDLYNKCTDDHWMEYLDSSCTWQDLKNSSAFSIERHALKISIPIRKTTTGYRPDCPGGLWGAIDFSNGYKWWGLSHTEIHLPSEHGQNRKKYDGEIQMYHLYSLEKYQMAAVGIFIQAYDNVMDDPYINKLICQWRKAEERTRKQCGLPSVSDQYPGCWNYSRKRRRTALRRTKDGAKKLQPPMTAYDVVMGEYYGTTRSNSSSKRIRFVKTEHSPPAFDVHGYLRDVNEFKNASQSHRKVLDYDNVPWFNYWPMLSVRTEYYHSYFGTATVPPCFGSVAADQANLWRLMKDPIRITKRQLEELNRLLVKRIAPSDDPVNPCEPDTAGVVDRYGRIDLARPLQQIQQANHDHKFCSCEDWQSRWPEDRDWCATYNFTQRQTLHPYNFDSRGF